MRRLFDKGVAVRKRKFFALRILCALVVFLLTAFLGAQVMGPQLGDFGNDTFVIAGRVIDLGLDRPFVIVALIAGIGTFLSPNILPLLMRARTAQFKQAELL